MNRFYIDRSSMTLSLLALVSGLGVASCKKPPPADSAPAASSSAGAASSSGPCATYAKRLCDKAGAESPTCQAINTATDLMPPDACTAGMKDIDFTVKKLAQARKTCDELTEKLCDAVGPDTQTCGMVRTQTKQFPPERCKAMGEHLTEVVAELKKMEEGNKPLSPELQTAMTTGPAASFGPANAKVQIVEFSDFQCPFCSKAADVVHQVKAKYGTQVHFTFRQFPLPMHPNAAGAAEAALAANSQGKFWEYHDRLFKNQQQLDRAGLEEQAKQVGINMAEFKKSLDEHKFAPTVESDKKLGEQVQVQGTPTLFINGAKIANPSSFEEVSAQIDAALKASKG